MKNIITYVVMVTTVFLLSACSEETEESDSLSYQEKESAQAVEEQKEKLKDVENQPEQESEDYDPSIDKNNIENPAISYFVRDNHMDMTAYDSYGYDDENYTLGRLEDDVHRDLDCEPVQDRERMVEDCIPDLMDIVDNDNLKKDFEDIKALTLDLKDNIDNDEKRDELVKELRDMYRDIDYYLRDNDNFDPPNVTNYAEEQS
ncbi:hypothetical protein HUG20_01370 [Salicibibacter cibi]|uniref:Lipoprotein n=1 Tax=Salicibibacter cibi TaxID=2743001 RepID=A0A7T6Z898_9BACI|nr:hypothetical protein [Salicibibacter cibi]QQK78682.1 hypothetical protein HUG20_01370 [Salicibibacter cibi]